MNELIDQFPPGACDTHMHFYDRRYPVAPAAVLRPPNATPEDYRALQAALGLERVIVVQPTTYGLDNSCQLAGMTEFGDAARGVMVVNEATTRQEIARLTDLGVRGARFHMLPGGAVPWSSLDATAALVAPFGWHIQLQLNGLDLIEHEAQVRRLPTPLVVDHIGRFTPPPTPDHASVQLLVSLVEEGRTWVKLSAPYESSMQGPDFADQDPIVQTLTALAPERMLWASNWPHPGQNNPLTEQDLIRLMARWLPTPELRHQVLVTNPAELYEF